ncbi:MAG: ATP-binding protein [Lachnospiraceae bacterium]|nr:ATP-binding protein [Lachnospiraceae bacterium]
MDSTINGYLDGIEENAKTGVKPEDYIGEDGLLHCGVCHMPKEQRYERGIMGKSTHPVMCRCRIEEYEKNQAEQRAREKARHIEELLRDGFLSRSMRDWTFERDNGQNAQMPVARKYVQSWEQMKEKNIGLLIWGDVGCGKSFLAGAIANALIDQEVRVKMTNFTAILNDLSSTFEGRNEYLNRLCSYPLLIIDDFGMERGTEYGLEQIYSVIDGRYRSKKPLIVTTNLTLTELRSAADTAHKRIYDRVLDMCVPIFCKGESFRKHAAEDKLTEMKRVIDGGADDR